jgi:hypothetical protein
MSLPRHRLTRSVLPLVLVIALLTALHAWSETGPVTADHAGGVTFTGLVTSGGAGSISGATISFNVSPNRTSVTSITATLTISTQNGSCDVIFSVGPTGDSLQFPNYRDSRSTGLQLPIPITTRPDGKHAFAQSSGIVAIEGVFTESDRATGTLQIIRRFVGSSIPCGAPPLPWTATAPVPPPPPVAETPIPQPPAPASDTPAPMAPAPSPAPSATPAPSPSPAPVAPMATPPFVYQGNTDTGVVATLTLSPDRTAVSRIRIGQEAAGAAIATSSCGRTFETVTVEAVIDITDGGFTVNAPDGDYEVTVSGSLDGDQISGTVSWRKPDEPDCATPVVAWTVSRSPASTG